MERFLTKSGCCGDPIVLPPVLTLWCPLYFHILLIPSEYSRLEAGLCLKFPVNMFNDTAGSRHGRFPSMLALQGHFCKNNKSCEVSDMRLFRGISPMVPGPVLGFMHVSGAAKDVVCACIAGLTLS